MKDKQMKYGNIFWGVILVTLGVLFALRNLDIYFFSWGSIFRLWPLIFVFWGISLLPLKSGVKLLLTVVTVVIGIILLANYPGRGYHFFNGWPDKFSYHKDYDTDDQEHWEEQNLSQEYNNEVQHAILNFDAAAGDFKLRGVTSQLFEFKTEGNSGPYHASTKEIDEETVVVDFSQKNFTNRKNLDNLVWMSLNENPIWKINIDVGAAKIDMDLTNFNIEKLDVDGGAAAIEIKLGTKFKKTQVNIDAGASGIKILVPEESACEVRTNTILSGRDLDGFNKIKSGLYQTPNFSDSANQIFIEVDAAVSGVKVERYSY